MVLRSKDLHRTTVWPSVPKERAQIPVEDDFLNPGYRVMHKGEIAYVIVRDEKTGEAEHLWQPTIQDISEMCYKYGFDFYKTHEVIYSSKPDIYGLMIEVHRFRKYCEESK